MVITNKTVVGAEMQQAKMCIFICKNLGTLRTILLDTKLFSIVKEAKYRWMGAQAKLLRPMNAKSGKFNFSECNSDMTRFFILGRSACNLEIIFKMV